MMMMIKMKIMMMMTIIIITVVIMALGRTICDTLFKICPSVYIVYVCLCISQYICVYM